jgi:predicted nucleic acid-binding protein
MRDRFFLDTNIFVYTFDSRVPEKQQLASGLVQAALKEGNASISYQVIQEFINVATRKFASPLKPADCQLYVNRVMFPLWKIYSSKDLFNNALRIHDEYKFGFYDSLIVSAAMESQSDILYSEDLQANQKVESLQIVNPFR